MVETHRRSHEKQADAETEQRPGHSRAFGERDQQGDPGERIAGPGRLKHGPPSEKKPNETETRQGEAEGEVRSGLDQRDPATTDDAAVIPTATICNTDFRNHHRAMAPARAARDTMRKVADSSIAMISLTAT